MCARPLKRSHVAACQSFSRLAHVGQRLQLRMPVEFRDLTDRPMPKSYSRWGDMRPRRIDSALGARKLLRAAIGLCGAVTSDLFVVLLGSTVREAFGAHVWTSIAGTVCRDPGTCSASWFLAAIPHSPRIQLSSTSPNGNDLEGADQKVHLF